MTGKLEKDMQQMAQARFETRALRHMGHLPKPVSLLKC